MRSDSRTERLASDYIDALKKSDDFEITEVKIRDLDIHPFDEDMLKTRDADIERGALDSEKYKLARDFASADEIIVSAPFWDAAFPSKFKVYIEHICVNTLTFEYSREGCPLKRCRANSLTYITTAGCFLPERPAVKLYLEELCAMFCIENVKFFAADRLDIFPDWVDEILDEKLSEMLQTL